MGIEEIRENLKDQLLTTWEQVRDSSTFMSIKEKYEILPQQSQKVIKIIGASLVVLILFMLPYSYISSSNEQMQRFEETRELLNDLLEAQSTPKGNTTPPPSLESLKSSVQAQLNQASLEPEQIITVSEDSNSPNLSFKNKDIKQRSLKVELGKLNLKQVVNIGKSLQAVHSSAKLVDIKLDSVVSEKEQGYFNVSYYIKTFEVPELAEKDDSSKRSRPRGRRGGS